MANKKQAKPGLAKVETKGVKKTESVKSTKVAANAKENSVKSEEKTPVNVVQFYTAGQPFMKNFETFETTETMEVFMTQGKAQFDKLAQDASKASREQWDVLSTSGNILFKGYEDVVQTWMSWAQTSAEKNTQAVKTLMGCKTLNEFTDAQNKFAQQGFDELVNGTSKISDKCVKTLTEALEPINDQVGKTMKKATEGIVA